MYVKEVIKGMDWSPSTNNNHLYFDQTDDFYLIVTNVTFSPALSLTLLLDFYPNASFTDEPIV